MTPAFDTSSKALHLCLNRLKSAKCEAEIRHLTKSCRGLCSTRNIATLRISSAAVAAAFERVELSRNRENLEQAARRARLEFFRRQMAAAALDRVALGHTRSDQAETVLFRFLRGAATAGPGRHPAGDRSTASSGLSSMWTAPKWKPSSRPRHPLARRFHQSQPGVCTQSHPPRPAAAIGARMESGDRPDAGPYGGLGVGGGRMVGCGNRPAGARVIVPAPRRRSAAAGRIGRPSPGCRAPFGPPRHGARQGRPARNRFRTRCRRAGSDRRPPGPRAGSRPRAGNRPVFRLAANSHVRWFRFPTPFRRRFRGLWKSPAAATLSLWNLLKNRKLRRGSQSVYNREMGCVDWPRISGPLELRSWRPGDRYQPIGHTGEEKIKKLFQEARIPLWERSGWPVLTDRSGIVWARRFGPAASLCPGAAAGIGLAYSWKS